MSDYNPKEYFDNGRTLNWAENIPQDYMEGMNNGEVFTLLDIEGNPYSQVLKDSYGTIRERRFPTSNQRDCPNETQERMKRGF